MSKVEDDFKHAPHDEVSSSGEKPRAKPEVHGISGDTKRAEKMMDQGKAEDDDQGILGSLFSRSAKEARDKPKAEPDATHSFETAKQQPASAPKPADKPAPDAFKEAEKSREAVNEAASQVKEGAQEIKQAKAKQQADKPSQDAPSDSADKASPASARPPLSVPGVDNPKGASPQDAKPGAKPADKPIDKGTKNAPQLTSSSTRASAKDAPAVKPSQAEPPVQAREKVPNPTQSNPEDAPAPQPKAQPRQAAKQPSETSPAKPRASVEGTFDKLVDSVGAGLRKMQQMITGSQDDDDAHDAATRKPAPSRAAPADEAKADDKRAQAQAPSASSRAAPTPQQRRAKAMGISIAPARRAPAPLSSPGPVPCDREYLEAQQDGIFAKYGQTPSAAPCEPWHAGRVSVASAALPFIHAGLTHAPADPIARDYRFTRASEPAPRAYTADTVAPRTASRAFISEGPAQTLTQVPIYVADARPRAAVRAAPAQEAEEGVLTRLGHAIRDAISGTPENAQQITSAPLVLHDSHGMHVAGVDVLAHEPFASQTDDEIVAALTRPRHVVPGERGRLWVPDRVLHRDRSDKSFVVDQHGSLNKLRVPHDADADTDGARESYDRYHALAHAHAPQPNAGTRFREGRREAHQEWENLDQTQPQTQAQAQAQFRYKTEAQPNAVAYRASDTAPRVVFPAPQQLHHPAEAAISFDTAAAAGTATITSPDGSTRRVPILVTAQAEKEERGFFGRLRDAVFGPPEPKPAEVQVLARDKAGQWGPVSAKGGMHDVDVQGDSAIHLPGHRHFGAVGRDQQLRMTKHGWREEPQARFGSYLEAPAVSVGPTRTRIVEGAAEVGAAARDTLREALEEADKALGSLQDKVGAVAESAVKTERIRSLLSPSRRHTPRDWEDAHLGTTSFTARQVSQAEEQRRLRQRKQQQQQQQLQPVSHAQAQVDTEFMSEEDHAAAVARGAQLLTADTSAIPTTTTASASEFAQFPQLRGHAPPKSLFYGIPAAPMGDPASWSAAQRVSMGARLPGEAGIGGVAGGHQETAREHAVRGAFGDIVRGDGPAEGAEGEEAEAAAPWGSVGWREGWADSLVLPGGRAIENTGAGARDSHTLAMEGRLPARERLPWLNRSYEAPQ